MIALSLLPSCGSGSASSFLPAGDTLAMGWADNLTVVEHPGFTEVTLINPWDTTKTLERLLLVDHDSVVPDNLPQGTLVRTPLRRIVAQSGLYASLLEELGGINAVVGVCGVNFVTMPSIKERINNGEIADCGNDMSPNVEQIVMVSPDALFMSPYEGVDNDSKLTALGIPIIPMADYMETSPLGRAEWMRLYGRLTGHGAEADSLFNIIASEYMRMSQLAKGASSRPTVLMDRVYSGLWDVPGKNSTTGCFIEDAGGINIFNDKTAAVSRLAPEEVLFKAHDADIWLIRYGMAAPLTMKDLGNENQLHKQIKAYREGNVYGCNTFAVDYFGEIPFHPHRLLGDMIRVFHPEISSDSLPELRYFQPLN